MKTIKRLLGTKIVICFIFAIVMCALLITSVGQIREFLFAPDNDMSLSPSSSGGNTSPEIEARLTNLASGINPVGGTFSTGQSWPNIKKVDTGKFHALLLDQDGFVYAWGSNEYQQLGLASTAASSIHNIDGSYSAQTRYYSYWQPVVALNHLNVTDIAAGGYHSIAIGHIYNDSSDYRIYTWGWQKSGALGNKSTADQRIGTPIDISNNFSFNSGEYPIQVAAGEHHSMLLTSTGRIFTWGNNSRGQLGLGSTDSKNSPTLVTSISGFRQIAAGSMHSAAIGSSSDRIYLCGDNSSYQLGTTSSTYSTTFSSPWTDTYEYVSAGELHNGAKRKGENKIDLWGCNRGGKLGYKPSGSYHIDDPQQRSATRQTYNYKAVSAGGKDTIAINTNNQLYVTGNQVNTFYGATSDQTFRSAGMSSVGQIFNGGTIAIIISTSNVLYVSGSCTHYTENWYGRTKTQVDTYSDGSPRYNTTPPVTAYNKNKTTIAPTQNLIGIPTSYSERSSFGGGTVQDKVAYNVPRVKITRFDNTGSNQFRVAALTKSQFDNSSYSGATFVAISTKGVILDKEGYYVIHHSGSTYTFVQISNYHSPDIELDAPANQYYPKLKLYDAYGLSSVSITGDKKYYEGSGFKVASFSLTKDDFNGATNGEVEIPCNSNTTFTVIAIDVEGFQTQTQIQVNTAVQITNGNVTVTYDGNAKSVAPTFYSPNRGHMNLSQFKSNYGSYTVSPVTYDGSQTAPRDVKGSAYNVAFSVTKGGATIDSTSLSLTINKKDVSVKPNSGQSKIYGNNDPALTYQTVLGGLASTDSFSGSLTRDAGETIGNYYIRKGSLKIVRTSGGANVEHNYNFSFDQTVTFAINKRDLTITPKAKTVTYGDALPQFDVEYTNKAPNDDLGAIGKCDYRRYQSRGTDGKFEIYVDQNSINPTLMVNYNITYETSTLTVNKRQVTVDLAASCKTITITFGDNTPSSSIFEFVFTNTVNDDVLDVITTINYDRLDPAGEYPITLSGLPQGYTNYTITSFGSGQLIVQKKLIRVKANDVQIQYGETPTFSFEFYDTVPDDPGRLGLTATATCAYVVGDGADQSFDIIPNEKVYTNYYTTSTTREKGVLQVLRRPLTVIADDKTITYGEDLPQFTFRYENAIFGDEAGFVESWSLPGYSGNAGDYVIQITTNSLSHDNYIISNYQHGNLKVQRRELIIVPQSRTIKYGDYAPSSFNFEPADFVGSDFIRFTDYTYADYQRWQPAGEYDIIVDTDQISVDYPNYLPIVQEAVLRVEKRVITIELFGEYKIRYNEEAPTEFEFRYTGLLPGDPNLPLVTYATPDYQVGDDVGSYRIYINEKEYDNYIASMLVHGWLIVEKADAIITVEEYQQTHTYDGTVKEVQAFLNHSETGFEYELVEYSYDSERGAPEFAPENIYLGGYINSGIYVINIIAPESKNYLASQTEQVTLIINRRPITVTADQASKIFGDQDPEVLTYKITTGTLGAEDNSLNGTLTRDAGEICDAIYYIRQGTVTTENNPNYDISFSSGVRFIINKREIRVVADDKVVTYGDETPELTITYINIIEGYEPDPSEEYIYTLYSQYQDAGEYTIYIEGRMYDNYVIKDDMPENGLLTVLRKKLTITAYEEITYGDPIPVFKSFIFDGLVADDTVPVIAYTDYQRYDDSGDYIILFDDSVLEEYEYRNYDAEFITGVLKVGKKDLIITADNKTIYYGDNAPEFTFSYIGLINGDVVEDIATTDYVLYDPVGTYRIIPFENEYRNYLGVQYNEGELIVEKRPIAITADDKEILFNEEAPQFTFTFENVVNEDRLEAWATTNYQKGDPVGAYTITVVPDLVYDNYVVAQTYEGTLNVIHAVAEIFAEELQTHIYDKTIKEVAAVLNHDETVLKYEPQKGYENAGTYTIRVYAETTQNYQAVERVITLVIERRDLTIQADYKEKIYGEADPALTYQYDQEALILTDEITGTLVREEGQDVGEYEIKQGNVDAGDNYNIIYISSFLKINPKPIEVTANPQQKVYGYSDPVLDYVITAGELLEGDELSGGLERETGEDVDEYEIGIGDLFNKNYAITFISDYLTIVPRPITIKAVSNSKIYGEADPVIAYDVIVGELAFDDKLSGRFEREDGEDIGFYEIYQGQVDEERNPNYEIEFIFDSLVKFEIKERPITVTADRIVKTYGDIDPELTYQITQGSLAFDDEFIGSLIREEGQDVKEGGYQISRGSFAISDGNLGQNYDLTFIGNIFEIEKRTIIIQAHGDQKTYGENDPPIFEYTMIEGNLAYDDQLEGRLSRDWGENAGDYNINKGTLRIVRTVSGQTETVDFNYDFVYILAIFKINPLKIVVKAEDLSQMYGYPDHQLVYEIIGTQLLEGDELQGQIKRDEGLDVGSYVIRQGDLGNPNYEIEFINATYTIYPRQIMIKAVSTSKVYGDDDPIIEYEVVQSELAYDDVLNGRFARVEGRNVGSYAITQGTIDSAHNPNYIIEYEPGGILTITKRSIIVIPEDKEIRYGDSAPHFTFIYENIAYDDVLVDTASTNYVRFMGVGDYDIIMNPRTYANYVAEYRMGTLKVVKRPVIITPNPAYVEFGSDPPEEFTFSYDGLVNNDKLQDTGYTDYQKGDYAGEYTIFVNEREYDNYIGTYRTGILYVIKARTIITGEIKQTKEYNGKEQTVDIEVNHNESELYYEPAGCINAGTYEIIVTTLETENHSAGLATFTLIIKPRVLRIEALSKNKNYGDDDPELEYEITEGELVEGDTLSGSLFRDFGQGVGEYEINQGTLSAGQNYEIVFVPGIFNIIPKQILIKPEERDKVYGEADPHFAYTTEGDGLVGGDRLEGTLAREQGEGVGTYRIIIGTLSHSNYEIDIAEAYFTIRPRNITIRAIDKEKVYGEEDPEMEYEIVFGSLAFEDELMGFLSREEGENVGEYEIQLGTIDNENNPNYNISLATGGRLTILKRSLTIEPEQMTKIYGYPDPELTYNIIEGELVNEDTLSGQLSRDPGNDAGEYAIRLGSLTAGENYQITFIEGIEFIILRRPITIIASNHKCEYGKVSGFELTFEIEGNIVPADRDRIYRAVYMTSVAKSDSPIGEYIVFINLVETFPNYDINLLNGTLEIIPATLDIDPNQVFPDKRVLYDGSEHTILINTEKLDLMGYHVTYQNNKGVEIGVYEATATITKQNHQTLTLNAKLIIMKNTATSIGGIYQGSLIKDDGLDPYVELMITQSTDEYILSLAQADIRSDKEEVKSIMNINLFSEGEEINIAGGAEIRLRIPPEVKDIDSLRLVYISDDTVQEVSYTVDGNYIVFDGNNLGSYAFITISDEALRTENLAKILFYTFIAVLVIVAVIVISAAIMNKSS